MAHPRGARHQAVLRRRALAFLRVLELKGVELSLSLVTDREIRTLNRRWRKKDKATDVLSFPAGDPLPGYAGRVPLGDVVISLDVAAREAKERGVPVVAELSLYLAHGLLHLLGHDHHRPAETRRMAELESRLLGRSGMILRGSDPLR